MRFRGTSLPPRLASDGRAGPLGHEALRCGRDHLVFGGDKVPAGLDPPSGRCDGAAQSVHTLDRAGQRLLDRRHDRDARPARSAEERGLAFFTHTLTVSEHYVRLAEYLRQARGRMAGISVGFPAELGP